MRRPRRQLSRNGHTHHAAGLALPADQRRQIEIDRQDVRNGAFGPRGAFEQIGDRYYRNDFYRKIQKESYRKVLRIMAENLDDWVTKQQIRAKFKGSDSVLDSAIKALRDRRIIRSKEGELPI